MGDGTEEPSPGSEGALSEDGAVERGFVGLGWAGGCWRERGGKGGSLDMALWYLGAYCRK